MYLCIHEGRLKIVAHAYIPLWVALRFKCSIFTSAPYLQLIEMTTKVPMCAPTNVNVQGAHLLILTTKLESLLELESPTVLLLHPAHVNQSA